MPLCSKMLAPNSLNLLTTALRPPPLSESRDGLLHAIPGPQDSRGRTIRQVSVINSRKPARDSGISWRWAVRVAAGREFAFGRLAPLRRRRASFWRLSPA